MANALPGFTSLVGPLAALERALSDFDATLAAITAQQQSADGKVVVVANSLGRVVSILINPSLVSPGDPVALASTVMTVANAAIAAATGLGATAAVSFASALSLPGLPAFGAPAPGFTGFAPTTALVNQVALANNPCQQTRSFPCRVGSVLATVDAARRIVALVFDSPLPEFVDALQSDAIAAINCAVDQSTNPPADTHNGTTGIVNVTVGFDDLVLYANHEIDLDPNVEVMDVGCQGFGSIGNAGTDEVSVSLGADVGNIVSRGKVVVLSGGHVHGSVRTEDKLITFPGATVTGPVTQNTAVILPILTVGVVFPANALAAINVPPNGSATAAPAYYRSIFIGLGATLTLSSGVYFTDSLDLELGSKIVVNATNGPVILWVKNTLIYWGSLQDAAGGFPRIWIGFVGTLPVFIQRPFQGSLVAPNATVTLATVGAPGHVGAFHAKSLFVSANQTICHRPFELPFNQIPGARPPDPPPLPIPPQTAAVLGFEDSTAWTSSQATLAFVTTPITQGTKALSVSHPQLVTTISSRAFSATGLYAPTGTLLIDVWITTAQGQLDVKAKIPSAGIGISVSFGPQSLSGKPTGRYITLQYSLPSNVAAAIANAPSDVTLSLVLTVPLGVGTLFFDNIRLA